MIIDGFLLAIGAVLALVAMPFMVAILTAVGLTIAAPFIYLWQLLNGIGEMSEWIADRNRAKRIAREKAAT